MGLNRVLDEIQIIFGTVCGVNHVLEEIQIIFGTVCWKSYQLLFFKFWISDDETGWQKCFEKPEAKVYDCL